MLFRFEVTNTGNAPLVDVLVHDDVLGHLQGNRFSIKIRQADEFSTERVEAVLEVLAARGVPNYFGPQRFGPPSSLPCPLASVY